MEQVYQTLGESGIRDLAAAFYKRMKVDDLVGAMYPPDDWEGAEQRFADFLLYRFGGSDKYIQERGHPRLRMRHMPFAIDEAARDRWLSIMAGAMKDCEVEPELAERLQAFFAQVADFLRNREG